MIQTWKRFHPNPEEQEFTCGPARSPVLVPGDLTLDDVARAAGVSRAAASRALNGKPGVRDDVRAHIEDTARALGYRRNRSASSLAGGRSSVFGFLLGVDELRHRASTVWLLEAVMRAADEQGQGVMLVMDSQRPNVAVRNLIADGLLDGVLVRVEAVRDQWVEELLDAGVPTVLIGAHPRRRDVAVVDVENVESSASLVGVMLDALSDGAQQEQPKLAIITGPAGRVDAEERKRGFDLAHERRGLVPSDLVFAGGYERANGYEVADAVIDSGAKGVFAANDAVALGFLDRAAERGLSAPEDLLVAGFDGTAEPQGVASVRQPYGAIAAAAVEMLLAQEVGSAPMVTDRRIQPEIFLGRTVGAASAGQLS